MPNAGEIRRHISAVEQTRKITNAMYMISSAQMQQARKRLNDEQIYFNRVQAVMKDLLLSPQHISSPYLELHHTGRRLYVVFSGDKGMAGSYNEDVLRCAAAAIQTQEAESDGTLLYTVGLTAGEFFRKNGRVPDREIGGLAQHPSVEGARLLAWDILDLFHAGTVRSVYLVYTPFIGSSSEAPIVRRLLPFRIHDYEEISPTEMPHDMQYLPSPTEVFSHLTPWYLAGMLYAALGQSFVSEQYARMNAMQSSTHNADELLKKLRMQYNAARQSAITQEIAEITGAVVALSPVSDDTDRFPERRE